MLDLSTCLKYYKREDIQEELLFNASSRELGVRYLDGHFGKRPDILHNQGDVLEFAKQGVSSFHISEEHWTNPLTLSPSLKKQDLMKMRKGWDLIIDVDCPHWELSKRITFAIIKTLKTHGITSIFCKFSGNKGFHVGVPFSSFPKQVHGKPVSLLFPEGVRRILQYITYYVEKHYSAELLQGINVKQLAAELELKEEDVYDVLCGACGKILPKVKQQYEFLCTSCGKQTRMDTPKDFISCSGCGSIVKQTTAERKCGSCGSTSSTKKLQLEKILGLDQVLIAPRHLYRMAYSLHEKSGLASVPINPFTVLAFDKSTAAPEKVIPKLRFLDEKNAQPAEATDLILKALDFKPQVVTTAPHARAITSDNVDDIQEKIPEEFFPPAIQDILKGLKDGKKRALFVLVNFLTSVGWDYEDIDVLLHQWNERNDEPLRETVIKSQLTYHKQQKKNVLPPNYSHSAYYADLGVGTPEELNGGLKNPVTYAKRRARLMQGKGKKGTKKSDEQAKKPEKPKEK